MRRGPPWSQWALAYLWLSLPFITSSSSLPPHDWLPCGEISPALRRLPCRCAAPTLSELAVDCDEAAFPETQGAQGGATVLPYGAPVVYFRQRRAGYQQLPVQILSGLELPLRHLDLSDNALRRLSVSGGSAHGALASLRPSLVELRLSDNLLGDTLNPIFATTELRGLRHLKTLDLAGNGIRAVEEGLLQGCDELQELFLGRNRFKEVPSGSLNGPKRLRMIALDENMITSLHAGAFRSAQHLEEIDLSSNRVSAIEGGAFSSLPRLRKIRLSGNRLTRLNSDVFHGAPALHTLDLSRNFIGEFPSVALEAFQELRRLNLSSNMIQNLDSSHLSHLRTLQQLDLSRNNLANIIPGTFLNMKQLKELDISVNSLRTIEDDAFEGLTALERLDLTDNNILLLPAAALSRLPRLSSLRLDANRVAALSGELLRTAAGRLKQLSIARNVVRELPGDTFKFFDRLVALDLSRNLLTTIPLTALSGTDLSITSLDLSYNRLRSLPSQLHLPRLRELNLAGNQMSATHTLPSMPQVQLLNVSSNPRMMSVTTPRNMLHQLEMLEVVDLSYTGMKFIHSEYFARSRNMKRIYMSHNELTEIDEVTFSNMPNISLIDLSHNKITVIKNAAFVNAMSLRELNLRGNSLTSFLGEHFNTGTGLEVLDLRDNRISLLSNSAFRIHPRLRLLYLSGNRLTSFNGIELLSGLQFLQEINLGSNRISVVQEMDFARLPRLRKLCLDKNAIESVSEMAFHNSTQLQHLDLRSNKLDRLGDRVFEGLIRLRFLDLSSNGFVDLPDTIFDRSRLQQLEEIRLADNKFEVAPLASLRPQLGYVDRVDLSHNRIRELPTEDSVLVNIKRLDLSFNPLSTAAVETVLGEPKTVRWLSLAGVGMKHLPRLETPFLGCLNLSHNEISSLERDNLERATILEGLDLSANQIKDISNYSEIWQLLHNLDTLNISQNPIEVISEKDFVGLEKITHLSMHSLPECTKIEKGAFRAVPNLCSLEAYGYPKLGYVDVQGVLQHMPLLQRIDIETKDAVIGNEQLQPVLHPRLTELVIRGTRLKGISSSTFSGLKAPEVTIRLLDTSVTNLPPTLFFPVPRSTKIQLDVTGSRLVSVSPQMVAALEERRGDLQLLGIDTIPIVCDCNSKMLQRWLLQTQSAEAVRCHLPEYFNGRLLSTIPPDDLTCGEPPNRHRITIPPSSSSAAASSSPSQQTSTTGGGGGPQRVIPNRITEPDIIWSVATSTEKAKGGKAASTIGQSTQTFTNDDTLIIGIVGGVVAFIAILVIVICIIRLRMSPPTGTPTGCASCKGAGSVIATPTALYAVSPAAYAAYTATLPLPKAGGASRAVGGVAPISPAYSTLGRYPQQQTPQPYFVATPSGLPPYPIMDEKVYR